MKTILFPIELLNSIKAIAEKENYIEIIDIIERKPEREIDSVPGERAISLSEDEAQSIAYLASVEHVKAGLKFPYWSDDHPKYDESHEDAFFEIQSEFFQNVMHYLNDFKVKSF